MRRNLLSSVLIEEQRRITPSRASPINEPFSLGKTDVARMGLIMVHKLWFA
jgi:hypothetical protein